MIGLLQAKYHEAGSKAHPKSELLRNREASVVALSIILEILEVGGPLGSQEKCDGQQIQSSDVQGRRSEVSQFQRHRNLFSSFFVGFGSQLMSILSTNSHVSLFSKGKLVGADADSTQGHRTECSSSCHRGCDQSSVHFLGTANFSRSLTWLWQCNDSYSCLCSSCCWYYSCREPIVMQVWKHWRESPSR